MSASDAGQLFSRESQNSRDETPTSSFSAQEVHELSKLHQHLSRAINGKKLPPHKLKLAEESMLKLEIRLKPVNAMVIEAPRDSDLHRFTVDIFHSLRELYLNRCPPSTVLGIFKLRFQLVRLEVINSGISSLFDFLGPQEWDRSFSCFPMLLPGDVVAIPEEYMWHSTTNLRLSNCGIDRLDKSMHLFPSLEQLDLSYNDISHVIHLQDCPRLSVLNLSNNRISVLSNLNRVISNVVKLDLSQNRIESLDGLEFLEFLSRLDVSNNLIDDFQEVSHLAELTNLESVILEGNMISLRSNYRLHVFTKFLNGTIITGRELPRLDGVPVTELESYAMRGIMFRPSYSVADASLSSPAVDGIYSRSPSRVVTVSARAPSSAFLADLVLGTPPRGNSCNNELNIYSRGRKCSSAGDENRNGNDYRNLSVVELDKRFNAALSVWTAALSNDHTSLSPKYSSLRSPSQVFESKYNKDPEFAVAKPSSALRRNQNGNTQFEIRDKIMRMQKTGDIIDQAGSLIGGDDIPLNSLMNVGVSPGSRGELAPSGQKYLSYSASRPAALKHISTNGTPASSPGTPRGNSSRSVSFALPESHTDPPNYGTPRVVADLSEKELLHLISLKHRNSSNGLSTIRRRRAKVAHVQDEVLSRLPSLLSEYRVQVEQMAFVPKESPKKYRSPKRELKKDYSPVVQTALLSAKNAEEAMLGFTSTSAPNSVMSMAEDEWMNERNDRERRKLELKDKLSKMQSSLGTKVGDECESGVGDALVDGAACDKIEALIDHNNAEIDQMDVAMSDTDLDETKRTKGLPTATASSYIDFDVHEDPETVVSDTVVINKTELVDLNKTDTVEAISIINEHEKTLAENEFTTKSDEASDPSRPAAKILLVPKVLSPSMKKTHLSLLDWEDDERDDDGSGDTGKTSDELPDELPIVEAAEQAVIFSGATTTVLVSAVNVADDASKLLKDEPSSAMQADESVSDNVVSDELLEEMECSDKVAIYLDTAVPITAVGGVSKAQSSSVDRGASASTTSSSSEPSVLGGAGTIPFPSIYGDAHRNSIDIDPTTPEHINPPYVGNMDYEQFGVIENLELYMREQVFSPTRPSHPAPYIQCESCIDGTVSYVTPPPYSERFVAVYREKVYMNSHTSHSPEGEYTSLRELSTDGSPQAAVAPKDVGVTTVATPYVILVATDMFLYVLKDFPRLKRTTKSPYLFRDSPIPVLIRVHPLQCLR